jgi:hypothetical protein
MKIGMRAVAEFDLLCHYFLMMWSRMRSRI